jgi:hypothetical protein
VLKGSHKNCQPLLHRAERDAGVTHFALQIQAPRQRTIALNMER